MGVEIGTTATKGAVVVPRDTTLLRACACAVLISFVALPCANAANASPVASAPIMPIRSAFFSISMITLNYLSWMFVTCPFTSCGIESRHEAKIHNLINHSLALILGSGLSIRRSR